MTKLCVAVVQFPHPGGEHDPGAADQMPWTIGSHGRKFLVCSGRYLDAQGALQSGSVGFWGEWEAQSRVAGRYPDAGAGMPRFVHEPFLQRPADARVRRQNTDPFVFGDSFLYSNCRQFTEALRPSRMQWLAPGSVILFGSTLGRRFVLDTLMVVGSGMPYVIGEPDPFGDDVPDVFRAAVLEPLAASRKLAGTRAVLYRGAAHVPGRPDLYSFVPASAGGAPFARPVVEVPGIVNPARWRSARRTMVSPGEAREVWHAVVTQIRDQGLALGVFLAEPEVLPGNAALAGGLEDGCAGRPCDVRQDRGCQ